MEQKKPIRILHVVTYMGRGGLETMIMNYYRHIDRSKVQFDFLVHRDFKADYDDEIESMGGIIFRIPQLIPWSLKYNRALNDFFSTHPEYKVVHVHQDCLSSVILKAAKRHGVPVRIAHSHNSNQVKNLKYLIKLYYMKQIPSCATSLFACSKDAGDWMFAGNPYHVLNNAINTNKYTYSPDIRNQTRCSLQINEDSLVLGHVGRFEPQKNHTYLLEIFAEFKKHQQKSILLLVGDGTLRDEIHIKAKNLGIDGSIIFTGVRSDISSLMQAMDVFVFPSLFEGLPVTMIEAQAAGLPCLISDKVPIECKKTDLVHQMPLEADVHTWTAAIQKVASNSRRDTSPEIKSAGYDITENAVWLQNYYLEQWSEVR